MKKRYTVKLIHSCGDVLDTKHGDDLADILRDYADEGSLADGDSLKIRDTTTTTTTPKTDALRAR